jgi:hypothetical protein
LVLNSHVFYIFVSFVELRLVWHGVLADVWCVDVL